MARLTRKNIKVFAGNATNNGVFGSLQANNPVTTNDVEQIQSLTAWGEGWDAATETSEDLPPLEEMQGVEYVTTYQQAYIMQEGIPEWAATVTYYKGCLAKEVTSTGFRIYNSLTDDNTGNLLSDTSNWKKVMDSDDLYAFDNTVVHKAGSETISGEKTFSVSPIVPTATSGDSSTKAASTEFVTTVASSLQTQLNQKATPEQITTAINTVLASLYPVGSLYMGTQNTCPLVSLISGSQWELVAQDRALWGGNGSNANTNIEQSLPNHRHTLTLQTRHGQSGSTYKTAYFSDGNSQTTQTNITGTTSYASASNSIYGGTKVQPPAYRVNLWRRIA